MYKCCFRRHFNSCAFCYDQCWEYDGCIVLHAVGGVYFGWRSKCHHLPRWHHGTWSVQVIFQSIFCLCYSHDSFLPHFPFSCSSFSFPMYCRSIAVAAISCILLLLPACSLGAVMCGSMDRRCGGHCPNQLRTPSQKSITSDTAAKILLRWGTLVYTCMVHTL